ncbi:MAG: DUF805 domain-containing protein [Gammaproteobacteria bacterium]|nr:DUF805 domain-containing protein [Gammaproteobacteria bacterium]
MSTAAADVFDRSPYQAPEAKLVDINTQVTEDKLFSFEGRVGVWRFNARMFQCAMTILFASGFAFLGASSQSMPVTVLSSIPAFILFIGAIVMMVYTSIKRLHDLNHSGWFYLINIIPIIGSIWTLYYALRPGFDEANRFGAPREATKGDKVMGSIGIVITLAMVAGSFLSV